MPRKKRSSWGAVQEVSRGVWRIRYRADLHDGKGYARRSLTFHGTRREADRKLAELRARYDCGPQRQVPTVQQLWESDVLPELRRTVASKTARSYESTWKNVERRWGGVRVDAIRGADVQDWLVGSLARRTGITCLSLMRRVTGRAYLLGYIARDPLAASLRVAERADTPPERTELDLCPYFEAARAHSPELLAGVVLMAAGGCRHGEALAVRAADVVWDEERRRAVFPVVDSVDSETGGMQGHLKNRQSLRAASVPGELGRELAEWAALQRFCGRVFVVDRGDGRNVSEDAFRRQFRRAALDAGLEPITPRSLRRSFATAALDAGGDAGTVNLAMGHTRDSRVLYTHYDRPDGRNAPIIPAIWDNLGLKGK